MRVSGEDDVGRRARADGVGWERDVDEGERDADEVGDGYES